ncbi:MerR family transcriptional regulator [Streptomyces sp. NPDC059909]|uniref:MerR family transcriptional regulator n=1 Tax=Streptomyces sp. NPDC059909 TaxID=3346998 RepID=UPI0036481417
MTLLTIGAFARASRLSAKTLRRYDELGLLPPARVDPVTGYRYYDRAQLERARLVAWLRRIGMPLARIRSVCELYATDADAAARDIRAYWARVEAETAARRDLAAFLVDRLSTAAARKDPSMSRLTAPLGLRCAALSDRGLVRDTNQDSVYAGPRLLAVADGYGGGGARAGSAAIDVLRPLESVSADPGELLNLLADAVQLANRAVQDLPESGTTLTALLWTGSQLGLVHIGDTRAYLLRGGDLFRITHDHTVVQSMIDDGSLTEDEAASHPRRAMLLRAIDGTSSPAHADIHLHEARAGDRYVLCSDGLFTVVPEADLRRVSATVPDPDDAARALVTLANEAGGPDNVGCVVADVVEL